PCPACLSPGEVVARFLVSPGEMVARMSPVVASRGQTYWCCVAVCRQARWWR
ncbi:hypothetical protein A2U01_0081676, partial [Trifolium medium]|nr:hypothetical protein [Trifolium medium]